MNKLLLIEVDGNTELIFVSHITNIIMTTYTLEFYLSNKFYKFQVEEKMLSEKGKYLNELLLFFEKNVSRYSFPKSVGSWSKHELS